MFVMRMSRTVTVAIAVASLGTAAACSRNNAGGERGADSGIGTTTGATAGVAGDSMAMPGAGATGAAAPSMAGGDARILAEIGAANGMEIAAGELAGPKAQNQQVKDFARDMVADHRAMQAQADSVVVRAKISPQPAQPDTLQQKLVQAREQLQGQAAGPELDRMYMDMQVRDHEGTLALLNAARGAAQNAELRTLIDGAIPKVQQHLDRARQVRTALGGG